MRDNFDTVRSVSRARIEPQRRAGVPKLDRNEPVIDFKGFVRGLKGTLGDQGILLMIDEADLLERTEQVDQRGEPRDPTECDLGAVEMP